MKPMANIDAMQDQMIYLNGRNSFANVVNGFPLGIANNSAE